MKRGEKHSHWKGGRTKSNGYIYIWISSNKYKKEQVLIMEKHIGRSLKSNELVHHINEIKDDNSIENLQLMTRAEHIKLHIHDNYIGV